MAPNDATIDIPLEPVQSNGGGLRNQASTTALRVENTDTSNEKRRWQFKGRRAKPENRVQKTGKVGYDGEEDTINAMGKIYKRVLNFSVVVCIQSCRTLPCISVTDELGRRDTSCMFCHWHP